QDHAGPKPQDPAQQLAGRHAAIVDVDPIHVVPLDSERYVERLGEEDVIVDNDDAVHSVWAKHGSTSTDAGSVSVNLVPCGPRSGSSRRSPPIPRASRRAMCSPSP